MKENNVPEPTKSELAILQVLWQYGPSTERFVNDTLNEQKRDVQYSTILKLMQIMAEKGLAKSDERKMMHICSAAEAKSKTKGFLPDRWVEAMHNGSASNLLMQLPGNKKPS